MKTTILKPTEITITHIRLTLPVRYDEEDIPNDFPLRTGDLWKSTVEMDTGRILGWPKGKSGELRMKVCDEGTYELGNRFDDHWQPIAKLEQEYVPNGVVPGEDGDYVHLTINPDGIITNWPKQPSIASFLKDNQLCQM